jgi:hypothetical protein
VASTPQKKISLRQHVKVRNAKLCDLRLVTNVTMNLHIIVTKCGKRINSSARCSDGVLPPADSRKHRDGRLVTTASGQRNSLAVYQEVSKRSL